jgi:fluoroquinolone transport system ATP-binding protein
MGDVEQLCDVVVFITKGKISPISTPRDLKLKYGKREVTVETVNGSEHARSVYPLEKIGENEAFLSLLKNETIETIHSGETSMEDIFIIVTGEEKYE